MGVVVADVELTYKAMGIVVITALAGEGGVGGDRLKLQLVCELGPLFVVVCGGCDWWP